MGHGTFDLITRRARALVATVMTTATIVTVGTLALPAGAQAQVPQQQGCEGDIAQLLQGMELYIGTLEVAVSGQVPNPQASALAVVRADVSLLDWCWG